MSRIITDPEILRELRPRGNLREKNLSGANLERANLRGANLEGAKLMGANLRGAILTGANIKSVDFSEANLENAHLDNITSFLGTRFVNAMCHNIILFTSNLIGANFTQTIFQESNLQNINFMGAFLVRANFAECELQGANFSAAHLDDANFEGSDLERTNFIGAYLGGVTFETATVYDNTRFTIGALSPVQLQQLEAQRHVQHQPIQGVAFEVHNQFNALNINGITDYLNNFNNDINHPINPNAIPNNNEPNNLFTPLIAFINKSELFLPNEKENIKNDLQTRILARVLEYGNIRQLFPLLRSVINFVSRQENNFIEQYIRVYMQDCLHAYSGNEGASCTKGMVERIITTLNAVSTQMLTEFPENQTYNDIKRLFPNIVFNEVVEEWARKYLEDGELHDEITGLTVEQRKQHFIKFMTEKYEGVGLINDTIRQQINNEADRYERDGILERMYFGGRRNRKTRKGKTKKGKNSRKTKRRKH